MRLRMIACFGVVCCILSQYFPSFNRVEARAPDPVVQALTDRVDMARLQALIQHMVDFGSRDSAYSCGQEATDWALAEFRKMGLDTRVEFFPLVPDTTRNPNANFTGNVIAIQRGTVNPDRIWIIGAHLDSINRSEPLSAPGADDDASGSALVLHTAEILAGQQFEDTIIYALWAAEEYITLGSLAYAWKASNDLHLDIQGYINFDMVGFADIVPEDIDIVYNSDSHSFAQMLFDAADPYLDVPIVMTEDQDYGADAESFWRYHYQAVSLIEDCPLVNGNAHSANDTIDTLNFDLISQMTKTAIAGLSEFAGLLPSEIVIGKFRLEDSSGDQDNLPDPGENLSIVVRMENWSAANAGNVQAVISASEGAEWITIIAGSHNFGSIPAGQGVENTQTPFQFAIHPAVPDRTRIELHFAITGSNGLNCQDDLLLIAGSEVHLSERHLWNLDQNPGWTCEGLWAWGQPQGQPGSQPDYPDPDTAATGTNVLGYNLNGGYENNMQATSLTTEPLDFTGFYQAKLYFQRWLTVAANDHAQIQAGAVDGEYTIARDIEWIEDSEWKLYAYPLGDATDNAAQASIRWVMGPTNTADTRGGWNIDDIGISGYQATTPGNVTGMRLVLPSPVFHPGDTFKLDAFVTNRDEDIVNAIVFVALEISNEFWFWPSWSHYSGTTGGDVDFKVMTVPLGVSHISILPEFTWPDTGSAAVDNIHFFGAITDATGQALKGDLVIIPWGFGPSS